MSDKKYEPVEWVGTNDDDPGLTQSPITTDNEDVQADGIHNSG